MTDMKEKLSKKLKEERARTRPVLVSLEENTDDFIQMSYNWHEILVEKNMHPLRSNSNEHYLIVRHREWTTHWMTIKSSLPMEIAYRAIKIFKLNE